MLFNPHASFWCKKSAQLHSWHIILKFGFMVCTTVQGNHKVPSQPLDWRRLFELMGLSVEYALKRLIEEFFCWKDYSWKIEIWIWYLGSNLDVEPHQLQLNLYWILKVRADGVAILSYLLANKCCLSLQVLCLNLNSECFPWLSGLQVYMKQKVFRLVLIRTFEICVDCSNLLLAGWRNSLSQCYQACRLLQHDRSLFYCNQFAAIHNSKLGILWISMQRTRCRMSLSDLWLENTSITFNGCSNA